MAHKSGKSNYGLDFSKGFIPKTEVKSKLNVSSDFIRKYLPKPLKVRSNGPSGKGVQGWTADVLADAVQSKRFLKAYTQMIVARERSLYQQEKLQEDLRQYDIDSLINRARELNRRFVLHVGPTNSGKTYQALQALRASGNGVYLGPLRLLALEMFDTLNAEGYPCSLLTGEESMIVEGSCYTASTIEMCDFGLSYDVAVIDEAQMIADRERGSRWTNALSLVQAKEVHVCLAPEALDLIKNLISSFESPCEVRMYERMTPLVFSGSIQNLNEVQPGDALIAFSRKKVLNIAAALEENGIQSSVIYGALPPEARREEIHKFANGTNNVVVATDAIGMGVSLPIRRVIFCFTDKYDGRTTRPLHISEIKQIAGRAGRFGKYDLGEVLTMNNPDLIKEGLEKESRPVHRVTIPFPSQMVDGDVNLGLLLQEWDALPRVDGFRREDMHEARQLLDVIKPVLKKADNATLYRCITCPFDCKSEELTAYWTDVCLALTEQDEDIPLPPFGDDSLEACETQYSAYDLLHQMMRRFGMEPDFSKEREELCQKINKFLTDDKKSFMMRCNRCGRPLPVTQPFGLCERCYRKIYLSRYWDEEDT